MLSLHTNNSALSAQSSISRTQSNLSTSMTRLSTGFRINSAMDDAAGLQIATRLKAQSSGMAVAMRNTQNATSMMQTAEGALAEASNILVRMKDLATQAADASANDSDKTAMQSEYDALASELTNIIGNTSFGGAKLLKGTASTTDVGNAQTKMDDAHDELLAATTAYGADPDPTDPSLRSGALGDYLNALDDFKADTTDTALADAMLDAKKTLDAASERLTKATAADADATAAYNAANDSQASGLGGGKFSGKLSFQIGASGSEKMELDLSVQMNAMQTALGGPTGVSARYNEFGAAMGATGTELTGNPNAMLDKLQDAINAVSDVRSSLGAAANRLEHAHTNLSNVSANTQAAAGRIMDVDFATESANMTSKQMLMQAGTAMLKQSNSMSSMVMSLLQ